MRNTARCGTGHDRPESAVTIAGIRTKARAYDNGVILGVDFAGYVFLADDHGVLLTGFRGARYATIWFNTEHYSSTLNQMKHDDLELSFRKTAATKAWFSVVRAYNLCDLAMNARLSAVGLRMGEHEILVNLLRSPGMTQQALAKRCFVAKSGISMLLTRMEAQFLLRREADPKDGRIKRLYLSPNGEVLAKQGMDIQDEIVEKMMSHLSNSDLTTLTELSDLVSTQLD